MNEMEDTMPKKEPSSHPESSGTQGQGKDLFIGSDLYYEMTANIDELKQKCEQLEEKLEYAEMKFDAINHSFFWRLTMPIRMTLETIKFIAGKPVRFYKRCQEYGFQVTLHTFWSKVEKKIRKVLTTKDGFYTKMDLIRQKNEHFQQDITISVLVPLYNTPNHFLQEMIDSVRKQTYGKWELCLADGSDDDHKEVGEICRTYAQQDSRIRYQKLEKNMGISGNTNACIDMSTGEYIALFDHDDLLHPAALYEVMKAITEQGADFIYTDETTFHDKPSDAFLPHYKPDFAPDTLRANNYICHLSVFSRNLLEKAGKFRPECDGSQDFDMVLRLTEQAKKIVHIPIILYYWRAHKNSVAENIGAKPYVIAAAHKAVQDHLDRIGLKGKVMDTVVPSMYRIKYELTGTPLVSILIPNMDHISDLKKCIDSIRAKTTYPNWEVIIIENNSKNPATFDYYRSIESEQFRIVKWDSIFNYSAINNFGAQYAKGEYLLLLNNDIEIITPDWIQEMLMFCQRSDVGAVGAKLYYPDDTIQHAGVGIGILTLAGHLHRGFDRLHPGYMGRLIYAQDLSAVTAACMMIRRDVWDQVEGFDEVLKVAFNDVDLCMRIRKAGYLIVWTPFAEMYHYESKSRGADSSKQKRKRFEDEVNFFQQRWKKELAAGDPYFNPNFDDMQEDFSIG